MKCLKRNQTSIYYALLQDCYEETDEYGNVIGQFDSEYSDPVKVKVNVSPARGTIDIEQFGINANYNRTIVTDDLNCPIDENSILWIGRDTDKPYNYVVVGVAKSINSITYAIREVIVNNA